MPVIFTGAGSDSGAGSGFICMPAWHAGVLWADAIAAAVENVMITVAIERIRRSRAGQDIIALS
jgi:hypothetical protein